ncbi:MAG: ABC transporter ATP-binding protein [Steroidobacteraceae bacterium]
MKSAAAVMTPLIALENVGQEFDDGRVMALRDVNLTIMKGESVAVIGPSGSGKTTLVLMMCGIRSPSRGVVRWEGAPLTAPWLWTDLRRTSIGMVFQDFNLFPTLTARENIEIAMFGTRKSNRERQASVEAALAAVRLSARASHLPHELSGGERQRVAIARSIVNRPTLLIADEPTGNLDTANSAAIIDLLFDLHATQGTTLVIVTHDPTHAAQCRRKIEIRDGEVLPPSAIPSESVT